MVLRNSFELGEGVGFCFFVLISQGKQFGFKSRCGRYFSFELLVVYIVGSWGIGIQI